MRGESSLVAYIKWGGLTVTAAESLPFRADKEVFNLKFNCDEQPGNTRGGATLLKCNWQHSWVMRTTLVWVSLFILFLLVPMDAVFSCGGECPRPPFDNQRSLNRHQATCQIYQTSLRSSMQKRRERLERAHIPGYRATHKRRAFAKPATSSCSIEVSHRLPHLVHRVFKLIPLAPGY